MITGSGSCVYTAKGWKRADLAGDGAQQLAGVHELAVGEAEELDLLHAEQVGRGTLLLCAGGDETVGRERLVVAALGAVGDHDVADGPAGLRQQAGGAGGAEVGVVRMGGYDEGALALAQLLVWARPGAGRQTDPRGPLPSRSLSPCPTAAYRHGEDVPGAHTSADRSACRDEGLRAGWRGGASG